MSMFSTPTHTRNSKLVAKIFVTRCSKLFLFVFTFSVQHYLVTHIRRVQLHQRMPYWIWERKGFYFSLTECKEESVYVGGWEQQLAAPGSCERTYAAMPTLPQPEFILDPVIFSGIGIWKMPVQTLQGILMCNVSNEKWITTEKINVLVMCMVTVCVWT